MSNGNDGHVTYPMNRQNAEWKAFCKAIDAHVENSYGRVMPPHQRDLVKRIAKGEDHNPPRPYIYRMLKTVAREVFAVVSAGQTAE